MLKLKNETWAFYAAAIMQTLAHEGSLKKVTFLNDDKNLVKEVLNRNLSEMTFNFIIKETIAILDTCYQEDVNNNVKERGVRYCGACYCWPPKWLVSDMKKFEVEQWIPATYLTEIDSYF